MEAKRLTLFFIARFLLVRLQLDKILMYETGAELDKVPSEWPRDVNEYYQRSLLLIPG